MKTTRLIRGFALKVVAFATRSAGLQRGEQLHDRCSHCFLPIGAGHVRDLRLRKQSPHTVADEDIVFVLWVKFIYSGQFFAQT